MASPGPAALLDDTVFEALALGTFLGLGVHRWDRSEGRFDLESGITARWDPTLTAWIFEWSDEESGDWVAAFLEASALGDCRLTAGYLGELYGHAFVIVHDDDIVAFSETLAANGCEFFATTSMVDPDACVFVGH